jgi:NTP pyrophosphatase (non-canonical NTP hydrolase)
MIEPMKLPRAGEITERDHRQRTVLIWCKQAFALPNEDADETGPKTRLQRFYEEATELAQAFGISKENLIKQIEITYARDVGEVYQEMGGVMVTLQAFAESMHYSLALAEHDEISRCNAKDPAHFQQRQREKREQGL